MEEHLQNRKGEAPSEPETLSRRCPSTGVQIFPPGEACREADEPVRQRVSASALTHWPVQIRLVPATAPFLKHADLLVTADCVPVACPDFHRDFLRGKVVVLGCPKFDDVRAYVEKFTEIFRTANIRSVTVLDMEVPCCSALPQIVREGMKAAGKEFPVEEITLTTRGKVREPGRLSAVL